MATRQSNARRNNQADDNRNGNQGAQSNSLPCDLARFMDLSKQQQKLYNETEGQFNHRCMCLKTPKDEDDARLMLEKHMEMYLLPSEQKEQATSQAGYYDDKIKERIALLVDKIIKDCKAWGLTEVRYSVICITGLDHGTKTMFAYPLFKLYRYTTDRDPAFMDLDGRPFESWNHFRDTNLLQPSLLCGPKDGLYSWPSTEVDLEYFPTPSCATGAEAKRERKKQMAIKGTLLALDVAVLAGSTALCFVAGTVGIAARVAAGFMGVSSLVHAVDLHHASTIGHLDFLSSGAVVSCILLDIALNFSTLLPCALTTVAMGGCAFMAVGFSSAFLATVFWQGIKEYRATRSVSGKTLRNALTAVFCFGNTLLQAPQVYTLIEGYFLVSTTPVLFRFLSPTSLTSCKSYATNVLKEGQSVLFAYVKSLYQNPLMTMLGKLIQKLKSALVDFIQNRNGVNRKKAIVKSIIDFLNLFTMEMADAADIMLKAIAEKFGKEYSEKYLQNKVWKYFVALRAEMDCETSRRTLDLHSNPNPQFAKEISIADFHQRKTQNGDTTDTDNDPFEKRIENAAADLGDMGFNTSIEYYAQCKAFIYRLLVEKIKNSPKLSYEEALTIVENEVKEGNQNLESKLEKYLETYKHAALPFEDYFLVIKPSTKEILEYVDNEMAPGCRIFRETITGFYVARSKNETFDILIQPFPGYTIKEKCLGVILRRDPCQKSDDH